MWGPQRPHRPARGVPGAAAAILGAMSPAFPSQPGIEVTPEQAQQAVADGTAVVVDVRGTATELPEA